MSNSWEIVQVFNNNVVLAQRAGERAVLVGTGIGFRVRRGQLVEEASIHEVFSPQYSTLLGELPAELISLSRELADAASLYCNITVTDAMVVMLADHINAAVDRALDGKTLPNPMQWEIKQFYPREFEFGQRALKIIKNATGVQLAEAESTAIALHVVNAGFSAGGSFADTARQTELLAKVLDIVEAALSTEADTSLDRDSMAAARFITHLRFLLRRLLGERSKPHTPDPAMLLMGDRLAEEYPVAHKIAGLVIVKLESELATTCSEDEVLYLTLHVARLMMKS